MLYCSSDMLRNEFNCYFSFWVIFYPLPPWQPKKSKFRKNEKKSWRYNHFTIVYQKSWSYAILFLRYSVWLILFFILGRFFALLPPLTVWKIKIFKKWKNCLEIASFYTSVPKIMIIYTVPETWLVTDVIVIFHFGLFSALLPQKSQF